MVGRHGKEVAGPCREGQRDMDLTASLCLSPFRSRGKLSTPTWHNFFSGLRTTVVREAGRDRAANILENSYNAANNKG